MEIYNLQYFQSHPYKAKPVAVEKNIDCYTLLKMQLS